MFFVSRKRKWLTPVFGIFVMMTAAVLWILCFSLRVPGVAFCEGVGEYSLEAQTEAQREEFFAPFGYSGESIDCQKIKVPSTGEVFEEYNEIQKSQGLDLSSYSGKEAEMYVLSLKSEKGKELYGFLIVYKNRVIGAHLSDCLYPAEVGGLCNRE